MRSDPSFCSSPFLDIDFVADDFGYIGVFLLGFIDRRFIVEALVISAG